MLRKNIYEAPDAELLEIRYEEAFLQGTGTPGDPDPIIDDDEVY